MTSITARVMNVDAIWQEGGVIIRVRIIDPVPRPVQKRRTCAYARVSSDSDSQADSLENQTTYFKSLITSNPEYEFVGIFADQGITGTTDNRPEFQKMLELCRAGEIDLIITKAISRFARNTTILLAAVRELKDLGVEVRFEKENISTLSRDGELMLTVLAAFAEEESRNVSENIKWRYRKKFENGELVVNTRRFMGYDKDHNGGLKINCQEAKIVKRIYIEYLAGQGAFRIAKGLNANGCPTVTGAKWHESTVLEILKNEKYQGDVLLQKTYTPSHLSKLKKKNDGEVDSYYIEDNHPAIISREMWTQVQMEMQKRAAARGNHKEPGKYNQRYPLTGMLYCSKCGATLKRRTWNSKAGCKKIVWQCGNYVRNGKDICPGTAIDDAVVSSMNIREETVVKEVYLDGKKRYRYSRKSQPDQPGRKSGPQEEKDGRLLPGINQSGRTVVQL